MHGRLPHWTVSLSSLWAGACNARDALISQSTKPSARRARCPPGTLLVPAHTVLRSVRPDEAQLPACLAATSIPATLSRAISLVRSPPLQRVCRTPAISCEAVAPVPRRRGHAAAPCVGVPGAAASLVSFIALFGGLARLRRRLRYSRSPRLCSPADTTMKLDAAQTPTCRPSGRASPSRQLNAAP